MFCLIILFHVNLITHFLYDVSYQSLTGLLSFLINTKYEFEYNQFIIFN